MDMVVRRRATGITAPSGPVRSLTSAVYASLRSDILTCRLPPGEKLPIALLAKRFDVSLSAVREALSRLVADGFVTSEDQRGFRVTGLDAADLADLTETRIEVESLALRRSLERGGAEWEADVRAAWAALSESPSANARQPAPQDGGWTDLHFAFHQALVSACGLDWLLRLQRTLFEQSERYRALARATADGAERDVQSEHQLLFEAALARDPDAATRALAAHFTRTMELARAALATLDSEA
ncbi:GntR family transcriptional regulator [Aquabacter cavernae]|uniref:GntR family transcriptional regulator n=1 Tax=Aquabacter cavernae TaxID=2496029 RepID=UPI001FE0A4EE|nr:GntR family transcriptional regulator [Aquabacter cavernae]